MAAKRSRKRSLRKKPSHHKGAANKRRRYKCSLPDICEYLERLTDEYLKKMEKDYRKLRIAVCQLDRAVFDGKGGELDKRFCKGGGSEEPGNPPTPPFWPS